MPATHPGATLRLSTLEVWEAIGQVRETQVQQANLLTALTHALTVTLVTPLCLMCVFYAALSTLLNVRVLAG